MKLSVVIVNWNARKFLKRCLRSLASDSRGRVRLETIVVDNASTDGSARMVREQFPEVRLIENEQNLGFAQANNQAISEGSSPYILLLNPDAEVRGDAIGSMLALLDSHPEVAAVGPRLLNPDGSLQVSCQPRPTLFREFWRLFHLDLIWPVSVYKMTEGCIRKPREVDILNGACLMLRRQAVEEVGGLDPDYFIYSEEVDLCRRLLHKGWKLCWVPEAEVIHYGGQSTKQAQAEMFLHLYRGKVHYFRKHSGEWSTRIYKMILGSASIVRQSLVPLGFLKSTRQRKRNHALAGYYRQLLKELPRL